MDDNLLSRENGTLFIIVFVFPLARLLAIAITIAITITIATAGLPYLINFVYPTLYSIKLPLPYSMLNFRYVMPVAISLASVSTVNQEKFFFLFTGKLHQIQTPYTSPQNACLPGHTLTHTLQTLLHYTILYYSYTMPNPGLYPSLWHTAITRVFEIQNDVVKIRQDLPNITRKCEYECEKINK